MSKTMSTSSNAHQKKYYVSQEERDFFSENGYLIIRNLIPKELLECFRQRFLDLSNDKSLSWNITVLYQMDLKRNNAKPENYINKMQDILYDPVFMKYSEDPKILHIASQFVGEEMTALNCMLVNKPPGSNRHPSHQDMYYFPIHPPTVIGVWTAIDRCTVDNGCLYCVPGSHKKGLVEHEPFAEVRKFYHVVSDEGLLAPEHKRTYLEVEPGDTVLIHPYLIHGSGPNLSKEWRKAMTAHYMSSSCQYVDLVGTPRESIVKDFEKNMHINGFSERYQDMWILKSKTMPCARSHL